MTLEDQKERTELRDLRDTLSLSHNSPDTSERERVIWWFNHYAVPPELPGGTRHFEIAKSLKRYNFKTYIFASTFSHFTYSYTHQEGLSTHEGIPFVWVRTTPYKRGSGLARLVNMISYYLRVKRLALRELRKGLPKPDLIIGSTVHPLAALSALELARKLGVPFIYEIRDLWPQTLIASGALSKYNPLTWIISRIERKLVNSASLIIVLAEETKNFLVDKYNIPPERILLIPNYINLDEVEEEIRDVQLPRELEEILNEYKDRFKVGYMGSLSFTHATDILIDVMRKLPSDISLLIIGDGPLRPKLEEEIKKFKLKNVRVLGPYPRRVIWKAVRELDTFIVIDRNVNWGSSNKLSDYLVARKPIIFATNSTQNYIEGLGIKVSLDSDEIVGKIIYLRDSYEKYLEKVKRIFPNILKRFQLEKCVKKLSEALEEIVKS